MVGSPDGLCREYTGLVRIGRYVFPAILLQGNSPESHLVRHSHPSQHQPHCEGRSTTSPRRLSASLFQHAHFSHGSHRGKFPNPPTTNRSHRRAVGGTPRQAVRTSWHSENRIRALSTYSYCTIAAASAERICKGSNRFAAGRRKKRERRVLLYWTCEDMHAKKCGK